MDQLIDPEEVARFENATWSRCASGYMDGFGALVGEAIRPLLDEVNVNRDDRVLDVGTGPGLVAAAAAERGAEVVGVDFSEAMLAEATSAPSSNRVPRGVCRGVTFPGQHIRRRRR